ncbi:transcription factor DUO1 [Ziziphus jujuba]|uniref:Transcription factor DUO1 n=1 Tax=Ziziphus jujuba TaxID=326968 RepID=A0A6P4AND9_ZIZJJ|nr:transcription factor DUO1 [Ziziphus jujuba]
MEEGIRKGPWKAEEDEVLLNHVKKYGPRDWSSIRSKGLLQRTGKSCRLRWVNKLRPNLKNGCKFSLEEERLVIELQAEFGNKWARIATYLPGRTDNDVKNFWSSRQKRLARILQTSSTPSKSQKNKQQVPVYHDLPTLEASVFTSYAEGESSRAPSCSSSCIDTSEMIKMAPLPELVEPKLITFESQLIQPETESQLPIPFPPTLQPQPDLIFPPENQDILARLDDPYFDMFGCQESKLESAAQLPVGPPFLEQLDNSGGGVTVKIDDSITPDCFFDDFPADMFDHIDLFPSPPGL